MDVNKFLLISIVIFLSSCKERNYNLPNGIYFNEEAHSVIGLRNDTLVYIENHLSGICDKYFFNGKDFIGEIYGDTINVAMLEYNLYVQREKKKEIYTIQTISRWDTLQIRNLRRNIKWERVFREGIDGGYSDADIGCFLLQKGVQMLALQTSDQSPIEMKLMMDGKVYSNIGAINWICLDIF